MCRYAFTLMCLHALLGMQDVMGCIICYVLLVEEGHAVAGDVGPWRRWASRGLSAFFGRTCASLEMQRSAIDAVLVGGGWALCMLLEPARPLL